MASITARARLPKTIYRSPEDIFAWASNTLFHDDAHNFHVESSLFVTHQSPTYGYLKIFVALPESPTVDAGLLWTSSATLALLLERQIVMVLGQNTEFSVAGHSVLELGAWTGVAGIVSVRAGARRVVISDHPSAGTIDRILTNVWKNLPEELTPRIEVQGHVWGEFTDLLSFNDASKFTRIICANCLTIDSRHDKLVHSIKYFLKSHGRAFIVAGFHAGRAAIADFFDTAENCGFVIEDLWEHDVNGSQRQWSRDGDGRRETVGDLSTWHVVAILKHADEELRS